MLFGAKHDLKERVRNVLNYKKPAFWIIIVAIVACIVVAVCFLTNPKDKKPDKDGNAVVDTTDDETTADETKEETIEDKYKKAKAALTILDETKKKEISALYNANLDVYWYDIDSKYFTNILYKLSQTSTEIQALSPNALE